MPSVSKKSHIAAGSTLRRHTWRAPIAVTAQGKHQPLQWNIGTTHSCTDSGRRLACSASTSAFRYTPRWVYMTPLGRPVVPEVFFFKNTSTTAIYTLSLHDAA